VPDSSSGCDDALQMMTIVCRHEIRAHADRNSTLTPKEEKRALRAGSVRQLAKNCARLDMSSSDQSKWIAAISWRRKELGMIKKACRFASEIGPRDIASGNAMVSRRDRP